MGISKEKTCYSISVLKKEKIAWHKKSEEVGIPLSFVVRSFLNEWANDNRKFAEFCHLESGRE